jgi:hypothetical protein
MELTRAEQEKIQALTAQLREAERVAQAQREAERELTAHCDVATVRVEQPLRFASYDDFVAWRRTRASSE